MGRYLFIENEAVDDNNYIQALKFAIQLKKEDPEVGRIVILLDTKSQYSLLNPFFPSRRHDNSGRVMVDGVNIPVFTLRTYQPYTVSMTGKDLLVTIGLDPDQFAKFEDEHEIKYIIHIPWSMQYSNEWIKSHNAIDILTGKASESDVQIDPWVKGAIDWLEVTSYPNKGFHHPNDADRLKVAANALAKLKAQINREAIVTYCLSINLNMEAADKMYEHFNRAQARKFSTSRDYSIAFLKEQWMAKRD